MDNTNTASGTAAATIDKETAGMNLKLDASVRLIAPKNNLLAFATVKIEDCFVVDNIKVVSGERGLFADMPSIPDSNGKYHDICFPITANFRDKLNEAVLEGYAAAVEKNMDIGAAQREYADKPGVAERLEAGKQKAAAHNAARPATVAPSRSAEAAAIG